MASATAHLHRLVTPDHVCPYGLKARWLLRRRGFRVVDHPLESKAEAAAFRAEHGVETTPQIWIEGERVGGYDALRARLDGEDAEEEATTYRPVLAIFAVAAGLALAVRVHGGAPIAAGRTLELFFAITMALLALQKLQDVESFVTSFLGYDLLARRFVGYGYAYPYLEATAALLMTAGVLGLVSGPIALGIGGIGAVSVVRAVWIEGRSLRCACVGGQSRVPLGFVSLTENLVMVGMGIWTLTAVALRHAS